MSDATTMCVYPNCQNPATTGHLCTACARRYQRLLVQLGYDYVHLRATMPKPMPEEAGRRTQAQSFGHPAEWASDMAREIADLLDLTSESVREHLGHIAPPPRQRAEGRVVGHALRSLLARMDTLCTWDAAADTCRELYDLHGRFRRKIGLTRIVTVVKAPCPNPDCQSRILVRSVDRGRDEVECEQCGTVVTHEQYQWWAHVLLAELLADEEPSTAPA